MQGFSQEKATETSYTHVGYWARATRVHVSSVWAIRYRVVRSHKPLHKKFVLTALALGTHRGELCALHGSQFVRPAENYSFVLLFIFRFVVYSQNGQGKTPY